MAVDSLVTLAASAGWVQLTTANATKATVIHRGGGQVILRATDDAVNPGVSDFGGLPIESGADLHQSGFLVKTIIDMSTSGAAVRIFGRATSTSAKVYVQTD